MSILILLLFLGLMYLICGLMIRLAMRHLSCQRSFSCKETFEGQEGELVETVRNDSIFPIPWLRLESYIGTGLQLGRSGSVDVSNDTHYCSCFTLMPYQQIRRRHYVKFVRRGVYDLGNAAISVGNFLGTDRIYQEVQQSTRVTVFPRLLEERELPFPTTQILGQLVTKNRTQPDPFMIRNIRPYQPGDLIRDIHWQATARTEELQVAVHDHTIFPRLLIVLNAQQREVQWDKYIRENDVSGLESDICLAASLCVYGIRNGLEVGIATNMPQPDSKESTLLMPNGGLSWQDTLLHSFARLQLRCSENIVSLLHSLRSCQDLDILVLSRYRSDSLQQSIQALQQQGNRVTLYLTEGECL